MGFQLSIRMEDDLHNKAEKAAKEAGQTLAEWVRRAMREKLEREADPAPAYVTRAEFEALRRSVQNIEKNTENPRVSESQRYAFADSRNSYSRK